VAEVDENIRELQLFAARRVVLLERVNDTGRDIDAWINTHANHRPTMAELGRFEVMLKERRDSLEALMRLDDDFVDYLVTHRGRL
jgi:hypothetical protein